MAAAGAAVLVLDALRRHTAAAEVAAQALRAVHHLGSSESSRQRLLEVLRESGRAEDVVGVLRRHLGAGDVQAQGLRCLAAVVGNDPPVAGLAPKDLVVLVAQACHFHRRERDVTGYGIALLAQLCRLDGAARTVFAGSQECVRLVAVMGRRQRQLLPVRDLLRLGLALAEDPETRPKLLADADVGDRSNAARSLRRMSRLALAQGMDEGGGLGEGGGAHDETQAAAETKGRDRRRAELLRDMHQLAAALLHILDPDDEGM